MTERYVVLQVPETNLWGVWERDGCRFLPACHEEEADGHEYGYRRRREAARICEGLNADPLGPEERRSREREEQCYRTMMLSRLNGWYDGRKTDLELRAAVGEWRAAGMRAEEGLNLQ